MINANRFMVRERNRAKEWIKEVRLKNPKPEKIDLVNFIHCGHCGTEEESSCGVFDAGWITNTVFAIRCVKCKKIVYSIDLLENQIARVKEVFEIQEEELK